MNTDGSPHNIKREANLGRNIAESNGNRLKNRNPLFVAPTPGVAHLNVICPEIPEIASAKDLLKANIQSEHLKAELHRILFI